jgi:O-antigen/teichoic acid export membrane protein
VVSRGRRLSRGGIAALLAGRAGWSAADQVLSSLSNFALAVIVARQVTVSEYGSFALAFALYGYLVMISRLLVSQPLMVRFSGAEPAEFERATRQSTGAAIAFGLVAGAVVALAGIVVGGAARPAIVAVGALLPGLLLQDAWRMAFFACGRPRAAAANDAAWGVVQLALVLGVWAAGYASAVGYLSAWGLAAWVAAALGAAQAGIVPAPRRAWQWLVAHWDLSRYFVSELVAINGATQLMLVLVAMMGGLTVVGTLRGAQVLTGPVALLAMSAMAVAIPELARRPWIVGPRLLRAGAGISAVAIAAAGLWGALLLMLPDDLGRQLLGDTWTGVDRILVPTVIGVALVVAALGPTCGIQAAKQPRVLFWLQLLAAPVYMAAGIGGFLFGGVFGAAVGIAIAHGYNAGIAWIRFAMVARLVAKAPNVP